jgi:pyridoxine 4-dehydrogenase
MTSPNLSSTSAPTELLGGTFTLAPGIDVGRMGLGAMQLAGPHAFGPPADRTACVEVVREAVRLGVNHVDTADFYGPRVTNEILREALEPYPSHVHLVTKVGALRDDQGGWVQDRSAEVIRRNIEGNLETLGVDRLEVVNLRMGGFDRPTPGSIAEPFHVLAELQQEGLIGHLGLSTVNAEQVAEAQRIAPVVCVQNFYNVAQREDDELIDQLADQGIAYVPYFPLGGFTPLQSGTLTRVAADLGRSPMTVALAWLLQRSPNILLIPGTSSVAHLRENLSAVDLVLPEAALAALNHLASEAEAGA